MEVAVENPTLRLDGLDFCCFSFHERFMIF